MKTVIEINGKKYDALTGALLPQAAHKPSTQTGGSKNHAKAAPRATIVDGISRPKAHSASYDNQQSVAKPVVHKSKTVASTTRTLDIKPAQKKTQRSITLLRSAVSKPKKSPQIHNTVSPIVTRVEPSTSHHGQLFKRINDVRLSRAHATSKSAAIGKFSGWSAKKEPILQKNLTIAAAPPLSTHKQAMPAVVTAVHEPKQQVFAHSIAQATHHSAPRIQKDRLLTRTTKKLKVRPRVISLAMASLAIVLLFGFLAYQNIPSVAMRVAVSRAGFNGSLPSVTPTGFAFDGPIQYGKGFITLRFSSNSDDRNFVLTQRPSDWTSESLLTNHILSSNQKYQTYHDKGLTVYTYSNGDATWVDKGVWYNLTGQGALSSDQILAIAGSL